MEIHASLGELRREKGEKMFVQHKKTTFERAATGKKLESHSAALVLFISMYLVTCILFLVTGLLCSLCKKQV